MVNSLNLNSKQFEDQFFVVTGSTQGLGATVAKALAARGAAGLIICGRNVQRGAMRVAELAELGCDAKFIEVDLSQVDDCRKLIAAAKHHFGTLHGLVNCAAQTDRGGILDTSPELFDSMFATNVKAPFFLMQDSIKLMIATGIEGSIVNIASMSGHGGQSFLTPYSVSKGAVATLTKNVAFSTIRNQIRVNALNIGWMDTPHEHEIQTQYHHASDDWLTEIEAKQPFKRLLKPEEVARTVCFLLSKESGMMTGAIIDMDQGVNGCGDNETPRPADPLAI